MSFEKQLAEIFSMQKVLMQHYHGFDPEAHLNPQTEPEQRKIRDGAIFLLEELHELVEAPPEELAEEMADCTHFLAELTIFGGAENLIISEHGYIGAHFLADRLQEENEIIGSLCLDLGKALHSLKATPWRKILRKSNMDQFALDLVDVWCQLILLSNTLEITQEQFFNSYVAKNQKNQERIANGY